MLCCLKIMLFKSKNMLTSSFFWKHKLWLTAFTGQLCFTCVSQALRMDNACFQLLRNHQKPFIKADQVHQNPWKSIKHGSTGSPKKVPKTASIECCARPLVPQVMKVCFILVLGHRYETCTLVFYRGVFKKKNSCPKCTHAPLFYRENGVKKNLCTPIL